MRNEELRGYFIDLETKGREVTVIDNLDEFYKLLGCRLIDVSHQKIGGKTYDVILDDEGLLRENPVLSMVSETGEPLLVGKLFIVNGNDETGEFESLTDFDVALLSTHILLHAKKGYGIICTGEPVNFIRNMKERK